MLLQPLMITLYNPKTEEYRSMGALTSCQAKFEEEDFPGILENPQTHQKGKSSHGQS